MTPDERDIEELLEAVASGRPADWERAESRAAGGRGEARVRALHDLARVADFHRGLQQGAQGESAGFEGGRWGDLLLLEKAGSGSAGDVYRAWDPALRRDVALKLARPGAAAASMLDEARALARVRDPHVVVVHGAAEHDGRAGFWMEYLRGATLETEMARRGRLPGAGVARLGAQLARALAAAHAAGALHRDVKPANVVLESDGRFVLVDFGLGQHAGVDPDRARPFSGTPLFMSPQRLAGAAATAADDQYALGVTLRWALAGRAPFGAASLDELRAEAASGPSTPLASECPDAPAALVAAIERLMAAKPSDRFASAAQAQGAFEAVLQAMPGEVAEAVARPRGPRAAQVAWSLVAFTVLAIAAVELWPRPTRDVAEPPVPAAPAVAYDVSATLVRSAPDGEVALADGDRVRPGDRLQLEFRATKAAWVYVLNSDDRGESYLLFPQRLFDRANPLPADSAVRLPGTRAGRGSGWVVTSRGGHEHFLIVASPSPVPELEAELSRLPAPRVDRPIAYARVAPESVERLRGVGGVSDLPASAAAPPGPADVFGHFRALAGREQGVRGTWVRQVTLRNPER